MIQVLGITKDQQMNFWLIYSLCDCKISTLHYSIIFSLKTIPEAQYRIKTENRRKFSVKVAKKRQNSVKLTVNVGVLLPHYKDTSYLNNFFSIMIGIVNSLQELLLLSEKLWKAIFMVKNILTSKLKKPISWRILIFLNSNSNFVNSHYNRVSLAL